MFNQYSGGHRYGRSAGLLDQFDQFSGSGFDRGYEKSPKIKSKKGLLDQMTEGKDLAQIVSSGGYGDGYGDPSGDRGGSRGPGMDAVSESKGGASLGFDVGKGVGGFLGGMVKGGPVAGILNGLMSGVSVKNDPFAPTTVSVNGNAYQEAAPSMGPTTQAQAAAQAQAFMDAFAGYESKGNSGAVQGGPEDNSGPGSVDANSGAVDGGPEDNNFYKGGPVTQDRLRGPDPKGPDDGAANLDVGEFVLNAKIAKQLGRAKLKALNEGRATIVMKG